jgi:hypothetical protein
MTITADVAVMVQQRDRRDAEAEIAEHCAWINAWAGEHGTAAAPGEAQKVVPIERPKNVGQRDDKLRASSGQGADDQLTRDLAEIAHVRDALLAETAPSPDMHPKASSARVVWLPFALRRTADSVPILLGTVLGLLMLIVFSAAAVFAKLAR